MTGLAENTDTLTILAALATLTMNEREALIDHDVVYRTQGEIAATMGVTRSRVSKLVQHGRVKLRRELERYAEAAA